MGLCLDPSAIILRVTWAQESLSQFPNIASLSPVLKRFVWELRLGLDSAGAHRSGCLIRPSLP
jgi:hypothetical protein